MKNAILYSRVSTISENQNLSISNQMLYDSEMFNIIHRAGERKSAFKDFKERKELIYILEDYFALNVDIKPNNIVSFYPNKLKSPIAETLIISNLSRLSRHVNQCTGIIEALHIQGCNVFIQDINRFSNDDSLLINILASLEAGFSETLSHKIKLGQKRSDKIAFNGTFIGWDYIQEENKLVINEDEAKLIRKVFNMYSDGFGGKVIGDTVKKTAGSVGQYLQNEMYKGFYNGIKCDKIKPIISEELFDRCLLIRESKNPHKGIYKAPKGLAGKLSCLCCGKKFRRCRSATSKDRHYYLKCATRIIKKEGSCPSVNISYSELNKFIYMELERQKVALKWSLDNLTNSYISKDKNSLTKRIAEIERELVELVKKNLNPRVYKLYESELLEKLDQVELELSKVNNNDVEIGYINVLYNNFDNLFNDYLYKIENNPDAFYSELENIDIGIKEAGDNLVSTFSNMKLIQFKHLYKFLEENNKPFEVESLY